MVYAVVIFAIRCTATTTSTGRPLEPINIVDGFSPGLVIAPCHECDYGGVMSGTTCRNSLQETVRSWRVLVWRGLDQT